MSRLRKKGGRRLRDWLLETEPDPARTGNRQTTVAELIQMPAFRDRLVLNALLSTAPASAERSTFLKKRGRKRGFRPQMVWPRPA